MIDVCLKIPIRSSAKPVYRALQPSRYGGLELDYGVQTMFARELGRACASSAWVGGILACYGWMAGMLSDEASLA